MTRETGSICVAGKWISTDKKRELRNPYNGDLIAQVSEASAEHLEMAVAAAENAAATFRMVPRYERARLCECIAAGIAARSDEFAELITRESGKPVQYSRGEVSRAITTFTIASQEALRFAGEVIPLDISAAGEPYSAVTYREPLGPVAAISPFNFPLNLVAHKIAPAFAVGCPVILKPAPQTPLTALLLAEVVTEAGAPEGALSVLPMDIETAEIMVRDDRLRILSFTGSAKVGWHLKAIAGKKHVLLELGGNAPAIVHYDADIAWAASQLAKSAFAAGGQVCIKAQRLLIHSKVYDSFQTEFTQATMALKVGDPNDADTVVGPLIDSASADRVQAWVAEAMAAGATALLHGGRDGNVLSPTILADVPTDAKCYREEIFGPVVSVEKYDDIADAIASANDTRYGLQASVFSFDTRIIDGVTRALRYGGVVVNDSPSVRVDNFPYGGMKDSGFGREGVRYTMQEFTETKVVVTRSVG